MSEWQAAEATSESAGSFIANGWAATTEDATPFAHARTMNPQLDDILTFISVMEAGSMASAATHMDISKALIRKRIGDLEAALRVELFDRSTDNVKPTELARGFYDRVVPLIRVITVATEDCINRLTAAWGGQSKKEPDAAARFALKDPLSTRERSILKLLADGLSNKEIARTLTIAPETVKSHVKNLFVKLNVEKRAQAVARGQMLSLVATH